MGLWGPIQMSKRLPNATNRRIEGAGDNRRLTPTEH
jgi:hypothetical protein